MVNEFSYTAKPQNNKARVLFGVSLAISFLGFTVYFIMERFRGFIGLLALFSLVYAIFVYTKYLSCTYYYDITANSDEPLFIVRQLTGKKHTALARICLHNITSVKKEDKEERRAHKTPFGYRKYVYLPTISPRTVYRITTVSRYEKSEIVIECTDQFAEYLISASNAARENYVEEE